MTNSTLDQTNLRQLLEGVKADETYFTLPTKYFGKTSSQSYVFKILKERTEGSIELELEPDFTLLESCLTNLKKETICQRK